MANLTQIQVTQLNILKATVNQILISIQIIELKSEDQRKDQLVESIEELLLDCQMAVRKIKVEKTVNSIFQNILNSL